MKIENIPASKFQFPEGKFGSLFHRVWSNAFKDDDRLRVLLILEDGGQPLAACMVWDTQKKWFRSLITPPLMPNCGWIWLSEFDKIPTRISKEKEVVSFLIDYLNKGHWNYWKLDFPSTMTDFQVAIWKGLSPKQKYTYQLSLKSDWLEKADSKLKNILKKKDSFQLEVKSFDETEFNEFEQTLFSKGVKHMHLLRGACLEPNEYFFSVVGEGGKYKALCLFVNGVVYYLAATNAKENNALSACGLAYCIQVAAERGAEVFDFEGSMIPEVERFFRGFGGELTPYFSLENGAGVLYSLRKIFKK